MTLSLIFGLGIGVSLGLLGGGGSIIAVPVLVYAAGVPANEAVGMSLLVVGSASVLGSFLNLRQGLVHFRAATLFSVPGIVGAFIGAEFTHLVPAPWLLLSFASLMATVAVVMLRGKPESELKPAIQCNVIRCVSVGLGVGLLTGFVGVGGGFLIVPAMVLFAHFPVKMAAGTSLVVIAINSAAGFFAHLGLSEFDWQLIGLFIAVTLAGMLVGTRVSRHVSTEKLRKGFAWFVLAVAAFVVAQNWNVIFEVNL